MFTGLIEDIGRIAAIEPRGDGTRLTIETQLPRKEISLGDSIAVNGICLTVTDTGGSGLIFDVSPETAARSTIRELRGGSRVNLERALKMGDRLGGHIVTGHIDCCATLVATRQDSDSRVLGFSLPPEFLRYLVHKGSITVDGISLTVNGLTKEGFSVTIIPHTFEQTTLSTLKIGSRVNIETDILGKYVERLLAPAVTQPGGLSLKTLAEHGFL